MPGLLELTIEKLEDGEVSPFFHDVAAVGDEIELRGPFGGFFIWSARRSWPRAAGGRRVGCRAAHQHGAPSSGAQIQTRRWFCCSRHECGTTSPYRDELTRARSEERWLRCGLHADARSGAARERSFCETHRCGDGEEQRSPLLGGFASHAYLCGSNPFCEAAAQSLLAAAVPERIDPHRALRRLVASQARSGLRPPARQLTLDVAHRRPRALSAPPRFDAIEHFLVERLAQRCPAPSAAPR